MYRIAKVITDSQVVNTELDPVIGERETTVQVMKLKFPFKMQYENYIGALNALDKIRQKGNFIVVKQNIG